MASRIFAKPASLSIQNPSLLCPYPYLQGTLFTAQIIKVRSLYSSAILSKDSSTELGPPSRSPSTHAKNEDASKETFNLFQQVREARPVVRYVVYVGLGLMVTVESTFWFHV